MSIFADDFLDLMTSTVSIKKLINRTSDNQPVYSTPVSYQARVVYKTHNLLGKENQLVASRGIIWLDTLNPVTVDDLVTLPDGSVAPVLFVSQPTDETGQPAYTRLDFQ